MRWTGRRTGGAPIDGADGTLDRETRSVARYTWLSLAVGHLFVTVWAASELARAWSGSASDLALAAGLALSFGVHVRCARLEVSDETTAAAPWWIVAAGALSYLLVATAPADPAFENWTLLPVPAVALAVLRLDRRYRAAAVVLGTGASLLVRYLAAGPDHAFSSPDRAVVWFGTGVVLGASYLFQVWFWGLTVRMEQARRMAGELAAVRERAQLAADVHDIQGHHLQVIALEAELASKLVDVDGERSRALLHQIAGRARRAMEETRALVHDSRRVSFVPQLENAVDVLDAAGIAVQVTVGDGASEHDVSGAAVGPSAARRTDGLDGETLETLGFVVREATTNLLRHSQAETVRVGIDVTDARVSLTILDEAPHPGGGTPRDPGRRDGQGLEGLRDRVQRLGGSLSAEPTAQGFALAVALPNHRSGGAR